jgi:hypothetical protein
MRILTSLLTDSNWHKDKEDAGPAVAENAWRFRVVVREAAVQAVEQTYEIY